MNRFILVVFILCIGIFGPLKAQDKYFVYFSDKSNSPYTTTSPLEYLSQKSVDRRMREGKVIEESDLPVNPDYLLAVQSLGATTFYQSRWFNGVLISATDLMAGEIAALDFVDSVVFVAPQISQFAGRFDMNLSARTEQANELVSSTSNDMIGVPAMREAGLDGAGVLIANFDSGFSGMDKMRAFESVFLGGRIIQTYDFVANQSDVFAVNHSHGTLTMSMLAGQLPDIFDSPAPGASFLLYRTEDASTEYRIEEYNWLFAAEKADSAGVDIISSSLSYANDFTDSLMNYSPADLDGKTSVITKAADIAWAKGIAVINAAGNKPWHKIRMPADCFDCISVGATNSFGAVVSFSGRGPTADGRIKPDLAAMGNFVAVIDSGDIVKQMSGTSFSSPQVAGLFAVIRQQYPELTIDEIKSYLFKSATNASLPNNNLGYGIPDFSAVRNYIDRERVSWGEPVRVYPTYITQSDVIIEVANPDENSEWSISLISVNGQRLFQTVFNPSWSDPALNLNVSELNQGIYILILNSNNFVSKTRIFVNH